MKDDIIKRFDDLTVRDIVLYYWLETQREDQVMFIRGRRRTMDEGIILCGGDVKRYMNYLKDYGE